MNTPKTNSLSRLRAFGVAAVAAAALGALAPMASAQTNNTVVLDSGTVIPVRLDTELTSNHSQPGDPFTATVDDSTGAYRNILQGATISGVVRESTPQQGSNPGALSLGFTRIRLSDGRLVTISGTPTSLDTKNLTTRGDGVFVAKNTSQDQRLTYTGIGAGAGILLDVLKGGKFNLQDILIGAGLGYGAGSILKSPQQVHDVDLTPGTEMGVMLNEGTRYYHRTPATVKTYRAPATVKTYRTVTTRRTVVTTRQVVVPAKRTIVTRRHRVYRRTVR